MCGRARLSSDVSEIKLVFSIPPHRPTPNFQPSWNVAPTDQLPVVRYDRKNEPSGFILTTILGIVGAFVATYLGQAIGWYRADQGAGLIGAVVGAVIILLIWGFIAGRRRPSP